MTWLALTFDYAALLAFALGMEIHHRAVLGSTPSTGRRLSWKCAGGLLLALALIAAIGARGVAVGLVLWFVAWAGGGLLLTWLLAWRPRWCWLPVVALALAGGVCGVWTTSA